MLPPTTNHLPQTTVVDFTVTQKGLEEQLLGGVIQKEQKSLEEQLKNVLEEVGATSKFDKCPTDIQSIQRSLHKGGRRAWGGYVERWWGEKKFERGLVLPPHAYSEKTCPSMQPRGLSPK